MFNNLLNSLRSGFYNKLKYVFCKRNTKNIQILAILQKNIIITGFEIHNEKIKIFPNLKIKKILFILISKPSNNTYIKINKIKLLNNSYKLSIISTTKGLLTDFEAKCLNIGGKLLLDIKYYK